MSAGVLLEMKNIDKAYPGVRALDDVSFNLAAGEIHALLGENGAGKSTLIKVLTGAQRLDGGEVFIEGRRVRIQNPNQAQHEGISTVYQEVNLCPNLSVLENIFIGREPLTGRGTIDWKTMESRAVRLLKDFDLDIDVRRTLDNYSVAVQQMVAIARSCDISAKVLILDEPTSSLSDSEVKKLFQVMRRLRGRGMGIVFVTHFLDQVYEITDRITVLRNGRYVCCEKTSELNRIQLISRMIGKEYNELPGGRKSEDRRQNRENPLFSFEKMSGRGRISEFSFDIHKGEIVGFAGLLASGRSEMARIIFGADSADSGTVRKDGTLLDIKKPLDGIRARMAFCPEERKVEGIISELSIRENIILALQTRRGMLKLISYQDSCRIADRYIDMLSIKTPSSEQTIGNLSGGNQQKVILGRWLATEPELLILDEPTRGIDVGTKAEIQKIVLKLAGEGMSVVFISSEIDEMLRCCGRLAVLKDRKMIGMLSGSAIDESRVMEEIAGDESSVK